MEMFTQNLIIRSEMSNIIAFVVELCEIFNFFITFVGSL